MTVLDSTGKVEIRPITGDEIYVILPLSISARSLMDEFNALARAKDLPADVREIPEGSFLGVRVPVAASREATAELLDGALRLIDEAQSQADTRRSAVAATEQHIRDWWESRKQASQGNAAPH